MGYVIDYKHTENCVIIKVEGKLNFKLSKKYSVEALKLARQNSCHKFLINHLATKPEDSGIYKLHTDGAALEKFGFKHVDKIAIVISTVKDKRSVSVEAEKDTKWSNFKYFGTIAEAINWLSADN